MGATKTARNRYGLDRRTVLWTFGLAILDLCLTSKLKPATVAEAIVCGTVAAIFLSLVGTRAGLSYSWEWRWVGWSLLLAAANVPGDIGRVFRAIARGVRGTQPESLFRAPRWPAGDDSPESTARRAMAIESISLSPGTYALVIDSDRNRVLVHQIVLTSQSPIQPVKDWPA